MAIQKPLNTDETSSNYSVKLSLSPHKSFHGTFLDSHSRFIQDPGWIPSQVRDQSFTHVASNETKYEKILNVADVASCENCSFIRLNDAFQNILLNAA